MFKRLFGRKNTEEEANSAETQQEKTERKMEVTTEAMMTIKKNMEDLQAKVDALQKKDAADMEEAKKLKAENPNDPRIKQILLRVKASRKQVEKYNAVLLKQQSDLSSVEDAAFLEEMQGIYRATQQALKSIESNTLEDLEKMMDDIEESKDRINEMMDVLLGGAQTADTDVDDLLGELDAEIEKDKYKAATIPTTALPSVPTTQPVVSESQSAENITEAEMEDMLAELLYVCFT